MLRRVTWYGTIRGRRWLWCRDSNERGRAFWNRSILFISSTLRTDTIIVPDYAEYDGMNDKVAIVHRSAMRRTGAPRRYYFRAHLGYAREVSRKWATTKPSLKKYTHSLAFMWTMLSGRLAVGLQFECQTARRLHSQAVVRPGRRMAAENALPRGWSYVSGFLRRSGRNDGRGELRLRRRDGWKFGE